MSSLPGRHSPLGRATAEKRSGRQALDDYLSFWRYSRRAISLVWSTHRSLTIALGLLTMGLGLVIALPLIACATYAAWRDVGAATPTVAGGNP